MLRLRGLPEHMALGIWTLFHQLLASDRHFDAVSGLLEKSFSVFDTGRELAGSSGVLSLRNNHNNNTPASADILDVGAGAL